MRSTMTMTTSSNDHLLKWEWRQVKLVVGPNAGSYVSVVIVDYFPRV